MMMRPPHFPERSAKKHLAKIACFAVNNNSRWETTRSQQRQLKFHECNYAAPCSNIVSEGNHSKCPRCSTPEHPNACSSIPFRNPAPSVARFPPAWA